MKITVSNKRNKSYLKSLFAGTIGQLALLPGDLWDNFITPTIGFIVSFIMATIITVVGMFSTFFAGVLGYCHVFKDEEWESLEGAEHAKIIKPKSEEIDGEHF